MASNPHKLRQEIDLLRGFGVTITDINDDGDSFYWLAEKGNVFVAKGRDFSAVVKAAIAFVFVE